MVISTRDKVAFCSGVANIFITALLLGMQPAFLYKWYTLLFCYFMPLRYWSYHRRGYHYFLSDLCYFVNGMLLIYLWFMPDSVNLFIATYCLANGSLAWAIIAWRNSLVFHSIDKVTSLFIHIYPPVICHSLVHLVPPTLLAERFPAAAQLQYIHAWPCFWTSTVAYTLWQSLYYFFILVKISSFGYIIFNFEGAKKREDRRWSTHFVHMASKEVSVKLLKVLFIH